MSPYDDVRCYEDDDEGALSSDAQIRQYSVHRFPFLSQNHQSNIHSSDEKMDLYSQCSQNTLNANNNNLFHNLSTQNPVLNLQDLTLNPDKLTHDSKSSNPACSPATAATTLTPATASTQTTAATPAAQALQTPRRHTVCLREVEFASPLSLPVSCGIGVKHLLNLNLHTGLLAPCAADVSSARLDGEEAEVPRMRLLSSKNKANKQFVSDRESSNKKTFQERRLQNVYLVKQDAKPNVCLARPPTMHRAQQDRQSQDRSKTANTNAQKVHRRTHIFVIKQQTPTDKSLPYHSQKPSHALFSQPKRANPHRNVSLSPRVPEKNVNNSPDTSI